MHSSKAIKTARAIAIAALVITAVFTNRSAQGEYLWIEAEKPASGDRVDKFGWLTPQDDMEKSLLSEGMWLCFNKSPENLGYVYNFETTGSNSKKYDIHIRKYWNHGNFRWRIDGGKWNSNTQHLSLKNNITIRTHISVNWALLGSLELSPGKHRLEIRTIADSTPLAIDCFCITDEMFIPRGPLQPGKKLNMAEEGYWAFEPDKDNFTEDCLLDLSYLNEDTAGENGFVTTRGGKFYLGHGEEVRFWGVGVSPYGNTLDQLRYQARRLGKLGVNLVRFHTTFVDCGKNTDGSQIKKGSLDAAHKLIAAMKDEGIYVTISPLFILGLHTRSDWNIPGVDGGIDKPFGLIFWDETLQCHYKSWLKQILTSNNPYTNIPLAKDPALCIFQLQNEDSCLFWTFLSNIPQTQRDALAKKYGSWLTKKFGSIDAAIKHFGDGKLSFKENYILTNDDPAKGTAAILPAWHMSSKNKAHKKRIAAQLEFLAQLQYNFNRDMAEFIKNDCGYDGLICANNWRTCDDDALIDLERWTYTACDVIDSHNYFGGAHENPANKGRSSYSVHKGDLFADRSVLTQPNFMPTNVRHIKNFPHIITESTWPQPNRLKAEAPLSIAASGRVSGLDAFMWFNSDSIDYENVIQKFQVNTPAIMGQFPAAALIYRSDYLKAAPATFRERVPMQRLYDRKSAILPEKQSYDPNRDKSDTTQTQQQPTSALSYLLGQVQVDYSQKGKPQLTGPNLNSYIKKLPSGKFNASSATNEIIYNSANGVIIVESAKIAAISGQFANLADSSAETRLSGGQVEIRCDNDYGCIIVISLDGQSLSKSSKILVQAMTTEKLYGSKYSPADKAGMTRIDSMGSLCWNVEKIRARVKISNPAITKATALDEYGYPSRMIPIKRSGNTAEIELPENSLYTILE